jgi:hypothetical protein
VRSRLDRSGLAPPTVIKPISERRTSAASTSSQGAGGGARGEEVRDRRGEALLHLGADQGAAGEHRPQRLGHPLLALDPLDEAVHPGAQSDVGRLGGEQLGAVGEEPVELRQVDRLDQVLAGRA